MAKMQHTYKLLKVPRIKNSSNFYKVRNFYEQCITHAKTPRILRCRIKELHKYIFHVIAYFVKQFAQNKSGHCTF